jgi:hypothetical protein
MKTKRAKRYLGMTVLQLVILGCLAFIACGMIAGGLAFVSGSAGGGGFSLIPSPAPSITPAPTFTPYLTETPTLTPTPTLVPYEDLIPSGWKQYTTTTIEMWLPPQFEPVDIGQERQNRIDLYKELGYEDIAKELEVNPPAYVFWFEVSEPDKNLYITNITIGPELMTAANLDLYLKQQDADTPQEFIVVNRQEFPVAYYEARRTLIEANLSNVYIGVAQYAIYDGVIVWIINCGSSFNEFYTWLPEFDKIARTFRLIDQ